MSAILTEAPKPQPKQAPADLLAAVLVCLLRDKQDETELRMAFLQLVIERHENFHVKHFPSDALNPKPHANWSECKNPVCREAQAILDRAGKPEVIIPALAFEANKGQAVQFQGTKSGLRVYLGERQLIQPAAMMPGAVRIR